MSDPGLLEGMACVVTGGARGIGRAVCQRFAAEGASVAVCDVLDEEGMALRDGLRAAGATSEYLNMDVSRRESVEVAAAEVLDAFGGVDVLVANAGILLQGRILDMELTDWQRTLDVNLTGVFHCCQAFGRELVQQGRGGRILITSSFGGKRGGPFYGAYSASKFGVIGLAESLAAELAGYDILVNCMCPGAVDTSMMAAIAREQSRATGRTEKEIFDENIAPISLGRYATPEEVADVFVFLASPLARYVTGQSVVVDGGMLIS